MSTLTIPGIDSLQAEGEMARLMTQKDWTITPVGSPETWPQSLRTTLSIILSSKFPMFLFWGNDLTCFYNDAYRPSLGVDGKHPSILGMRGEEAWAEIWTIIKPLIAKVLSGGGATWSEDQLIPIYRNGKIEDVYWTFSYSPVTDESGKPAGVFVTCSETTEKVIKFKRLEESEREFHELADSLPQMVWTTDKNGNQTFASKRWKEFTGLDPKDETTFRKMVHPDDFENISNTWTQALATKTTYIGELRIKNHAGHYQWFFVKGEPIKDENGEIEKWVGSFTNIQEIKELDQQKDDFLSMASHELRTPVTTIKAYGQIAESMLLKKGDTETLDMIQKMGKQVNRLTTLIEDLLDISKIQQGKLMFHESLFDLNELLLEVTADMQKTSATHGIKFISGGEAIIFAARDKIGQVLNNLISNAIKYSPSGDQVVIRSALEKNGIHVSVRDFGIGISEKEQAHVFKQFYRVAGGNQATYPGMGIGLYICSEIIKEHAGKIWVESESGDGSTFNVWLPFDHRTSKKV